MYWVWKKIVGSYYIIKHNNIVEYNRFGWVQLLGVNVYLGQKEDVGDIIEIGVIFPKNFINDGNHNATMYVSRNEKLTLDRSIVIPNSGLFPKIMLEGTNTRLQYIQ